MSQRPDRLIADFQARNNDGPAVGAFPITPDDGADLAQVARAFIANITGAVRVTLLDGSNLIWTVTEVGVQPFTIIKVWETDTDAGFMDPDTLIGLV
jgi:hypothetical protein